MSKSVDALMAVLVVTMLMFFVFSLMGMQLFYNIKEGKTGEING